LNPIIFQKTINELNLDEKYKIEIIENNEGNSNFIKNFKNLDIGDFFKENEGGKKVCFAKKYVEIMNCEKDPDKFFPIWINEIKIFLGYSPIIYKNL